jgi:hypothetical protein
MRGRREGVEGYIDLIITKKKNREVSQYRSQN